MTRLPGLWLMVGLAAGSALTPLVAFQGPGGRLSPAVPPVARRASMKGSGGARGKCTVEVVVDGVAEIEIQGDNALLQTLQGQPASWVRFECTDALPRLPDAFKFTGIEGRGRQLLVRDPRGNRGVAVVRIEDPKSGREGYTFDLEWRGSGNAGPAAFDSASGRVADHAVRPVRMPCASGRLTTTSIATWSLGALWRMRAARVETI